MQKKTLRMKISFWRATAFFIYLIGQSTFTYAQVEKFPAEILKSQKAFCSIHIPPSIRGNYSDLIKYSKRFTNHFISDFVRSDSLLYKGTDTLNIIEGYNANSLSFIAWIWKDTDNIYRFDFPNTQRESFKKLSLTNLFSDDRKMIELFSDLKNKYYQHLSEEMGTSVDGINYLGSKVSKKGKLKVETFAFYK